MYPPLPAKSGEKSGELEGFEISKSSGKIVELAKGGVTIFTTLPLHVCV